MNMIFYMVRYVSYNIDTVYFVVCVCSNRVVIMGYGGGKVIYYRLSRKLHTSRIFACGKFTG